MGGGGLVEGGGRSGVGMWVRMWCILEVGLSGFVDCLNVRGKEGN